MRYVIALFAAGFLAAAPLFAQDGNVDETKKVEEEKSGQKVEKSTEEAEADGDVETEIEIILPDDARKILKRIREELERDIELPRFPDGSPDDVEERIKKIREKMEKRAEEMRQRMKRLRKEIEEELEERKKNGGDVEKEVEEYESDDGRVKIKIVRIRKTSESSGESKQAQESNEEPPRKQ